MAVIKVFLDTSMGLGLPGLNQILIENRIAIDHTPPGTMFMFLNRKRTQVKIIWDRKLLLHFRKDGDEITIEELKKIPSYFKTALFGDKIEKQLTKFISKRVSVTVDEDGLKVV